MKVKSPLENLLQANKNHKTTKTKVDIVTILKNA